MTTRPDYRAILYQFFQDHPFVLSGGPEWLPLAWSMGMKTGREAEQLTYEAIGATLPVPGLGPFQPYRQRALYGFSRGMIQSATGGTAFEPWQGFQEGPPQGFGVGRRSAEWRGRTTQYERPPRPFPPGPWILPPTPAPRFAPGHPWHEFAVQRFRGPQSPYGGRRGSAFARSKPLPGSGYSAGRGWW